ncbi:hypothetical protein [Aneurinibacillus thermoaerophilus]|uniref:hypothetical protein n=1 Tax=Aneurinibacillus thermoaerophilus TaxID=143495 RepID=UPI002E1F58DD|nr:hypothetical protein [Aneurinibacillus thermoaerophilus]
MAKYRKKPVVIEAIETFNGMDIAELKAFAGDAFIITKDGYFIRTLEGDMRIDAGDYIIKGVKGEFYPCKPDIFEATYERVDE